MIPSPLSTTPDDLGLSENQRQVVSRSSASTRRGGRRVVESGGVGEWRGQKACCAHLGEALHTSSRTRTSRVLMCPKTILSPMSYGNYIPVQVRSCRRNARRFSGTSARRSQLASHDQHEAVAGFAVPVPHGSASQSGASATFWCWPESMRSLVVSLQQYPHR